jgi:hypothetical protein
MSAYMVPHFVRQFAPGKINAWGSLAKPLYDETIFGLFFLGQDHRCEPRGRWSNLMRARSLSDLTDRSEGKPI